MPIPSSTKALAVQRVVDSRYAAYILGQSGTRGLNEEETDFGNWDAALSDLRQGNPGLITALQEQGIDQVTASQVMSTVLNNYSDVAYSNKPFYKLAGTITNHEISGYFAVMNTNP